jgi:hypothetical protein
VRTVVERRLAREDEGVDGGAPAPVPPRLGAARAEADNLLPALQRSHPAVLASVDAMVLDIASVAGGGEAAMTVLRMRPAHISVAACVLALSGGGTVVAANAATASLHTGSVRLSGQMHGTDRMIRAVPDLGSEHSLSGSGHLNLGLVTVSGSVHGTGFIASGYCSGSLRLRTTGGKLLLSLRSLSAVSGFHNLRQLQLAHRRLDREIPGPVREWLAEHHDQSRHVHVEFRLTASVDRFATVTHPPRLQPRSWRDRSGCAT